MLEHAGSTQLEREVDVAGLDAKQAANQKVVPEGVDGAEITLAGAVKSIRADDVGVVIDHEAHRSRQFRHVKREVGVGVQNEITGCGGKSGLDRSSELAVLGVMHDPDVWIFRCDAISDFGSAVG